MRGVVRDNEEYEMKSIKVWDVFVRVFHWTLVGSMFGLYISGEEFKGLHIRLGYFVIILVLARITWGFIGTKYARFSNFLYKPNEIYGYLKSLVVGKPKHYIGHNPAGGFMIFIILIALLVTTFTGLKVLGIDGKDPLANIEISVLRLANANEREHEEDEGEEYNSYPHTNKEKEEFWEKMHEIMTSSMVILITLHVCGVFVSSWLHKENLILSMITGNKEVANHSTNSSI